MNKKVVLSIVAVAVVSIVAVFVLGFVYAGVKSPDQKAVVVSKNYACGEDIVAEYKKLAQADQSSLDEIVNKIQSTKGYEKDIVCNYILLVQAQLKNDKNLVNTLADRIKNNSTDASLQNIQGMMDLNITQTAIDVLTKSVDDTSQGEVKDKG